MTATTHAAATSRRRLVAGFAAAAGTAALAGCAPRSHARLTIVLDWLFNVNHALLFAAQQTGAFARRGLDVDLVAPADPDSPTRLVGAGQADLAVGYGDQINLLADKGLPVARIATLIDRPMNAMVALGGAGVRTLADLKGRRIGISVGGVEEIMVGAMLRSAGVAAADVSIVRVNYQMVTALLDRKIDAAFGAFRNAEVLEIAAAGRQPLVFAPEDHGIPPYDELILAARRDRLGDPRLAKVLAALKEAAGVLRADDGALLKAMADAHRDLNAAILAKAWPITLAAVPEDPARLDADRYLKFQAFCRAAGLIGKELPLDQFAAQIG